MNAKYLFGNEVIIIVLISKDTRYFNCRYIIEYEISFFRPQKDMPAGEEHIQHTVCINGAHKLITTTLAKFIAKTVCS